MRQNLPRLLKRRSFIGTVAATPLITGTFMTETANADDLSNTVNLELKYGPVTIVLRPDLAPKSVERIKTLTAQGFYNGCQFFRVIAGFMAQTGDPSNTGTGGSPLPNLPAEFTNDASFLTGAVGLARTSDPNSANSQFFICFAPATFLDGQYTIVGQVTAGMDAVQQIKKGDPQSGAVVNPDSIIKMSMAG
jgi:cyclophilin family peptidyl-prolyl cis-trans isomerase